MINLEKHSIKIDDVCYVTLKQAAVLCEMEYQAIYKVATTSLRTYMFANVMLVNLDDLVEYNNHRLYKKALKNKKKDE